MSPRLKPYFQFVLPLLILVILLVGLVHLVLAHPGVRRGGAVRLVHGPARRCRGPPVENIGTKRGPSLTVLFSAPQGSSASNSPWREQQRYSFAPPRSWGIRNSLPCSGYSPHQQQTVRRHTGGEADEVPLLHGMAEGDVPVRLHLLNGRGVLSASAGTASSGSSSPAAAGELPAGGWTSGCCRSPGTRRIAVVSCFLRPARSGVQACRSSSPSAPTPKISARRGEQPHVRAAQLPLPLAHRLGADAQLLRHLALGPAPLPGAACRSRLPVFRSCIVPHLSHRIPDIFSRTQATLR